MAISMNHKMAAAIVVAIVVFVGVHFVSFPGSVPDFRRASGGGTLLDMTPEFSEDALYARLTGYGATGRANYAFRNMTADVLLPLGLLPFLFMWMRGALDRLSAGRIARTFLLAAPISYVVFDLLENGAVLALLANFPARMHLLAGVLPYLTIIKRSASMLAIIGPVIIFGFAVIRTQWTQRHRPA